MGMETAQKFQCSDELWGFCDQYYGLWYDYARSCFSALTSFGASVTQVDHRKAKGYPRVSVL
jgi:hypothetical protein